MVTEEKDTKKMKLASKIGFDDLLPLIEKIRDTTDLYEKNKTLYEVIRKIPSDFLVLKDAIREHVCNEKDKIIGKREFDSIWKKTHPIKKTSAKVKKKLKSGAFKEDIKYDDSMIRVTDAGIFTVRSEFDGGVLSEQISEIFDGDIDILYKTKSMEHNDLFTYRFNSHVNHTQTLSKILKVLDTKIYKGQFGRDIIKKYFNVKAETLPQRKPKEILGFNNGWILPQKEDEKDYAILLYSDIHAKVYESAKKMIKEYTDEQKKEIINLLKDFVKKTQINKTKLSIIIGWSMAAPFRLPLIDILNVFPILCLIGSRNTGKSYINEFWGVHFYKILKRPLSPYHFASVSRTEDYLSSSTFPLNFQEVSYINREVIPILKEHCTGSSSFERKTSATEIFSRPKSAPICIDANNEIKSLSDHAINTKIINLSFSENEKITRDPDWIELFQKLKKEKLFSFVYDITKSWKTSSVSKELKKIETEFKKDIDFMDKYYPRLTQIFQVVLFGVKLFEGAFKIKLSKEGIVDELVGSRRNLTTSLLEQFYEFIKRARSFDEEKYGTIKYINHKLKMNTKRDYDFTQENLKDFNDYLRSFGSKPYNLKELGGMLNDGLPTENKDMIKYTSTTRDGRPKWIIIIKNKFLPAEKLIDEETDEDSDELVSDVDEDWKDDIEF